MLEFEQFKLNNILITFLGKEMSHEKIISKWSKIIFTYVGPDWLRLNLVVGWLWWH